ncbi:MAG: 5-deoxy-glucuronate isomerase [Opitutaceae bacterium]
MPSPHGSPWLLRPARQRFARGYTPLLREDRHALKASVKELMDFGVLRQGKGQVHRVVTTKETVWVLLRGNAEIASAAGRVEVKRTSLFDEAPTVLQVGAAEAVALRSLAADTEWAVVAATNARLRGARLYLPANVANEDRGAGLAQEACRRTVRTVFDFSTQPDSQLVVGEVVNRAGRWSSYPPHHHPQPEVYHYRFTEPQGYGHAELGEDVVKVREGDSTLIPGGLDHAQVAAPGYGMYYLWIVRHLPRRPYKGFTFTPDHTWLLDPKNQGWKPSV